MAFKPITVKDLGLTPEEQQKIVSHIELVAEPEAVDVWDEMDYDPATGDVRPKKETDARRN